ncbi:MAG: hypothetical protein ACR2L9_00210 [Solirubrobacteraceae bacterium]
MRGHYRLTPVGVGVVILLLFAVAAMLFGSHGLQAAGFVVVVLVACLGAMALLSSSGGNFTVVRRGGYGDPTNLFGGRGVRAANLFDPEPDPDPDPDLEHKPNAREPAGIEPHQDDEPRRQMRSGRSGLLKRR